MRQEKLASKRVDVISTHCKVYPNYSVIYNQWESRKAGVLRPDSNRRKGDISTDSMRRIKQYVTLLFASSIKKKVYSKKEQKTFSFKLNFITLTLPSTQKHSDNYILLNCLQPFIRTLKRKYHLSQYLWKAERQKNGNIHFHITTNIFIHHKHIRRHWNYLMLRHGYIDTTANPDPNSTDIHAVKNTNNLASYIAKYISKASKDTQPINCKLWDCSNELKQFNFTLHYIDWDAKSNQQWREIANVSEKKSFDYCTLLIHKHQLQDTKSQVGKEYKLRLSQLTARSNQKQLYEVESFSSN